MNLSGLKNNDIAIITKVTGRGAFRKRIIEMGFVRGREIKVIKNAPLKDPIEYSLMGYEISLRRSEAAQIEVITIDELENIEKPDYNGTITREYFSQQAAEKGKIINIALVGNPNCGKTTLFNHASGARERVGNYSGVTIDAKEATFVHNGYTINITDLPGTYSITAYSPEELYVRNHIIEKLPDIVVNVVDASNLERNLYLTTQLIDMDIRVVMALNIYDELQKKGDRFDYQKLASMLGIPIIPTVGSKGKGLRELFDKLIEVFEDRSEIVRHIHINYGNAVENAICKIQEKIKIPENLTITDKISSRFLSLKLLEKDADVQAIIQNAGNYEEINQTSKREIEKIESKLKDDTETIIADAKYGFISGALKETYVEGEQANRKKSEIIDTFITHKLFGFPVFVFFMWLMFQATFSLGEYPMNWIESLVNLISSVVSTHMQDGSLKDLIVNGIIGGVGGVIVFLPNILILFFFISFMEDTGYMARAAFIMDRIMHKMGLHGKSFIPLVMGFGCNVPAIMATRTIENKSDRLLTMLINPFMSCSARLPVYVLLISAFFPEYPGTMLFVVYAVGVLVSVVAAVIFKKTIFRSHEAPFVMELPPYRVPTIRSTMIHMWNKAVQYLQKMGGVILIASILIWALGYYPVNIKYSEDYDKKIVQITMSYDSKIQSESDPYEIQKLEKEKENEVEMIEHNRISEKQEKSYIGRMGHWLEPVIAPLGFDWKMGVSLIAGVAAKEIIVSTMGVLYHTAKIPETVIVPNDDDNLALKLRYQTDKNGMASFNALKALSFMIFILLYFPCIATIAAIKKESGSWKWALFTVLYTTIVAYVFSLIIYQAGNLLL